MARLRAKARKVAPAPYRPNRIASAASACVEYIKAATAMPAAPVITRLAFCKVEISACAVASSLPRVSEAGAPSKAPAALRQKGTMINRNENCPNSSACSNRRKINEAMKCAAETATGPVTDRPYR